MTGRRGVVVVALAAGLLLVVPAAFLFLLSRAGPSDAQAAAVPVTMTLRITAVTGGAMVEQRLAPDGAGALPARVAVRLPNDHPGSVRGPAMAYRDVRAGAGESVTLSASPEGFHVQSVNVPHTDDELVLSYRVPATDLGAMAPIGGFGGTVRVTRVVVEAEPVGWRCARAYRTTIYESCPRQGNLLSGDGLPSRGLVWRAPDAIEPGDGG